MVAAPGENRTPVAAACKSHRRHSMRFAAVLVFLAAGACSQPEDPFAHPPTPPDHWDPTSCAWRDTLAGSRNADDTGIDVVLTSDGGVVVGGAVNDEGDPSGRMLLSRYSAEGEELWTTRDNGELVPPVIHSIAIDPGDRVAVTGSHQDLGAGWVAEYEADGVMAWTMTFDTDQAGSDVCFTPGGDLYVIDYTGWLAKLAPDGELIWDKPSPDNPGASRLACDDTGGVIVLGDVTVPGGPGSTGPAYQTDILRYDADGAALWSLRLGEEFETVLADSLLLDPTQGEILASATYVKTDGDYQAQSYIHRIDPADGAITARVEIPDKHVLAADEGGFFIDGRFLVVRDDDDCNWLEDECNVQWYWGYAYLDQDGDEQWREAEAEPIENEIVSEIRAVAAGDGHHAVTGMVEGDLWLCYQ